jgi:hypothetical protein
MSTATTKKERVRPDWSAINRGMDQEQRDAFNAWHYRLYALANYVSDEVMHFDQWTDILRERGQSDVPTLQPQVRLRAAELLKMIREIPSLFP